MEQDCHTFVKKCTKCEKQGNLKHAPSQKLKSMVASWPFSIWGIDIIGMINPNSQKVHKLIITFTKYFTKWIEAIPLKSTKTKFIIQFIIENINTTFWCSIITNHRQWH